MGGGEWRVPCASPCNPTRPGGGGARLDTLGGRCRDRRAHRQCPSSSRNRLHPERHCQSPAPCSARAGRTCPRTQTAAACGRAQARGGRDGGRSRARAPQACPSTCPARAEHSRAAATVISTCTPPCTQTSQAATACALARAAGWRSHSRSDRRSGCGSRSWPGLHIGNASQHATLLRWAGPWAARRSASTTHSRSLTWPGPGHAPPARTTPKSSTALHCTAWEPRRSSPHPAHPPGAPAGTRRRPPQRRGSGLGGGRAMGGWVGGIWVGRTRAWRPERPPQQQRPRHRRRAVLPCRPRPQHQAAHPHTAQERRQGAAAARITRHDGKAGARPLTRVERGGELEAAREVEQAAHALKHALRRAQGLGGTWGQLPVDRWTRW